MQNMLLVGTSHLHHWHQGPKGVWHVHLGALGDHLQGHMGYQKICLDCQMQNLLLVGTLHPHHRHQGPKGVGHVHLGALGDHLQHAKGAGRGHLRAIGDHLQQICWDFQSNIFIGWNQAHTPSTHNYRLKAGLCIIWVLCSVCIMWH